MIFTFPNPLGKAVGYVILYIFKDMLLYGNYIKHALTLEKC